MALTSADLPKLVELLNLIDIRVQVRRKTAAAWTASDEVLLAGEWGKETDTGKLKQGDGVTTWNTLTYFSGGGGTSIGPENAGTGISIDATDPAVPVISSTVASLALSGRVATYSALPTGLGPSDSGKAYLVDADGLIYVWSGTSWPASGAGLKVSSNSGYTTPPTTGWSQLNPGSCQYRTDSSSRTIQAPVESALNLHCEVRPLPATTKWRVTAAIRMFQFSLMYTLGGVILLDSASNKCKVASVQYISSPDFGFFFQNFSNLSTFVSTYAGTGTFYQNSDVWIRLEDDGTNLKFYVGLDSETFFLIFSHARTTYLTPDKIGFAVSPQNSTRGAAVKLLSWKEEIIP